MQLRTLNIRPLSVGLAVLFAWLGCSPNLFAQAGLREALEKLDRDGDGEIEPHEITPLARPYLERIAEGSRMAIGRRDYDIEEIQEAARRYYAEKNGVDDQRIRPDEQGTVKPFGPLPGEPLVPELGAGELKYPYIQDDLDLADRMIRSRDRNDDGYIDRREAARERWTHRDPFLDDLDKDDRLSRLELAQRYARRRMLDRTSDELRQKAWRTDDRRNDRDRDRYSRSRSRGSRGSSYWLTYGVMGRFDENDNDRLEKHEADLMGLPFSQIDIDLDGSLDRDELYVYLEKLQEETGASLEGIPGWFYELDKDRDGQVSVQEFVSEQPEKYQDFVSLDLNEDGLLTDREMLRSKAMMGGDFRNTNAEVIPPGRTVISEIEIEDDIYVGDLKVQLSITHSNDSDLDAYLTGPDGQRVELFTAVGGRDNNFENTVFDDNSDQPITKARPPFDGSFIPEAKLKRQPSLSYFEEKNARGVWQLVVRATRSERFGMLHRWSLQIRPIDKMLESSPEDDEDQEEPMNSQAADQGA